MTAVDEGAARRRAQEDLQTASDALVSDVRARHPGEDLNCPHLRRIERALERLGVREPASARADAATCDWYRANAAAYASETLGIDMKAKQSEFVRAVGRGGRALDLGAGSGRDAVAFREAGLEVTAVDACEAMAAVCSYHTGHPVTVMDAVDVGVMGRDLFEGVWASAVLLHLEESGVERALAGIGRVLAPGGVAFVSFKAGDGMWRDSRGRLFNGMSESRLREIVARVGGIEIENAWREGDVAGRADAWLVAWLRASI